MTQPQPSMVSPTNDTGAELDEGDRSLIYQHVCMTPAERFVDFLAMIRFVEMARRARVKR